MRLACGRFSALTIACLAALGACSYPDQPPGLLVSTAPPGASCIVTRAGLPVAAADPTPAIARVLPEDGAVAINCRRRGFADASIAVVPQATNPPGLVTGYAPVFPYQVDIALVPLPPGRLR